MRLKSSNLQSPIGSLQIESLETPKSSNFSIESLERLKKQKHEATPKGFLTPAISSGSRSFLLLQVCRLELCRLQIYSLQILGILNGILAGSSLLPITHHLLNELHLRCTTQPTTN